MCCRHLYGDDRLLTAWRARDHAVVLLVGPHSSRSSDIYSRLVGALNMEMPGEERAKPPCCEPGEAPPADAATVEQIVSAVEGFTRPRRRKR